MELALTSQLYNCSNGNYFYFFVHFSCVLEKFAVENLDKDKWKIVVPKTVYIELFYFPSGEKHFLLTCFVHLQ